MLEEVIHRIKELYITDTVAILSLTITLIFGICNGFYTWNTNRKQNKKSDMRQEEQELIEKKVREQEEAFRRFQKDFNVYSQTVNEMQFEIENRSNLIPYFHINRTKSTIDYNSDGNLYVKLYLTNTGRGTAVNIRTCPIDKDYRNKNIYFLTDPKYSVENTHGFHDYFSENFAVPNESIKIEIIELERNDKQLYFIKFKIRFDDVMGREYEQEFRFGYDNYIVNDINQNSTSYEPKLLNKKYREN